MRLKPSYSSREVAAFTGLTARALQWWDEHRVLSSSVGPRRTAAGGFTERRYSPVDLLELLVLANLRRRGFSVGRIRQLLQSLREHFGVRLFDALGGGGSVHLLTDGRDLFVKTAAGQFFDPLNDPTQPLLAVDGDSLREISARAHPRRKRPAAGKPRTAAPATRESGA
jgi:DNA-binding transcriptional MerR regulator